MAPRPGRDGKISPNAPRHPDYPNRTVDEQVEHLSREVFATQQWRDFLSRLPVLPPAGGMSNPQINYIQAQIEQLVKDLVYYFFQYNPEIRETSGAEEDPGYYGDGEGNKRRGRKDDEDPESRHGGPDTRKPGGGSGEGRASAGVTT